MLMSTCCYESVTGYSAISQESRARGGGGMGDPWSAQIMDIARFRGDTKRRLTRVIARLQPVRAQV